MNARVTVEFIDDRGRPVRQKLAVDVLLHEDIETIVRDDPRGALFWIFNGVEKSLVAKSRSDDEVSEAVDEDEA